MIKKKLKLYYKVFIQLFFKFLYGKIKIPTSTNDLIKKEKINDSKFKFHNNKNYYIYTIKNARIYTDNNENVAVIKDNFVLPFVSFQQINGKFESINNNSTVKQGTPSLIKKINGKVFNICQGDSGNNYFHFIFDILPKIYLLKSKIDLKEIDYFYVTDPKEWQIKIFKFLGISKKKLVSSKIHKHILVKELLAVDHPWYNHGYFQKSLKKIPKWIIFENRKIFLKDSKKNKKKRIFLDRSQSNYNHCQIKNFIEIKKLSVKKNLKIYKPEFLSFKKQVNLFKNSSIVVGAHGAAFTNIIFCKPRTKIIEIIPADHPNRKCERISKILNLKYFRIKTNPDNSNPNYPFRININKKNIKIIENIINL